MATNTMTGEQLMDELSDFIGDAWRSTTTSAGAADGTTLIDTALRQFGDHALDDGYLRITSGSAAGQAIRVVSNIGSTITVAPGFTVQIATSVTYEYHRYEPARKLKALDRARLHAFPKLAQVVYDETLTTDGNSREYDLASTLRVGPYFAYLEVPIGVSQTWNLLGSPAGDSLTGWTLSGGTRSLHTRTSADRLLPKYGDTCTRIDVPASTAVTYTQAVSGMQGVTAAQAAGRLAVYGMWVYCRVSGRVTLRIDDDAGSPTASATHQGRGWEFLRVERVIDGDNATTFSVYINVSSAAAPVTVYWQHAWLAFDHLPDPYLIALLPRPRVRRDGSVQRIMFHEPPEGRRQLRLVGRGPLSALSGSTTATMEVDSVTAELLVGVAARLVLEEVGLTSETHPALFTKIATVEKQLDELNDVGHVLADEPAITGPYY